MDLRPRHRHRRAFELHREGARRRRQRVARIGPVRPEPPSAVFQVHRVVRGRHQCPLQHRRPAPGEDLEPVHPCGTAVLRPQGQADSIDAGAEIRLEAPPPIDEGRNIALTMLARTGLVDRFPDVVGTRERDGAGSKERHGQPPCCRRRNLVVGPVSLEAPPLDIPGFAAPRLKREVERGERRVGGDRLMEVLDLHDP